MSPFDPQPPRYTFEDLVLPKATRDEIMHALAVRERSALVFGVWGLRETHRHARRVGINLYGPPGTGKTMAANRGEAPHAGAPRPRNPEPCLASALPFVP